jgi:rhodanese-related sulfurtransferase
MFDEAVPAITPAELPARLADGWMLLDVRNEQEWAQGRIEGSVHIPMDQVVARLDQIEARVVCICAVGARSARVAAYLNRQGREAVNLDGGIYAWADEMRPIQT